MSYRDEIIEAKRLEVRLRAKVQSMESMLASDEHQFDLKNIEAAEIEAELVGQIEILEQLREWARIDKENLKLEAMPIIAKDPVVETDNAKLVTQWMRVNRYKYANDTKAVEEFASIHGGDAKELYHGDFANDRRRGLIGKRMRITMAQESPRRRKNQG